jgi:hypothetical protein
VEELLEVMEKEHSEPELEEFDYSMPTGYKIPSEMLTGEDGSKGYLTGNYYKGVEFDELIFERNDPDLTFSWTYNSPDRLPNDGFSIRWEGNIHFVNTGIYNFFTANDDGVRLYLDNQLIIDDWNAHGVEIHSGTFNVEQPGYIPIVFEYFENIGGAQVKLRWSEKPD